MGAEKVVLVGSVFNSLHSCRKIRNKMHKSIQEKKIHYSGHIMTKGKGDIHEKYICSSAYCVHAGFL